MFWGTYWNLYFCTRSQLSQFRCIFSERKISERNATDSHVKFFHGYGPPDLWRPPPLLQMGVGTESYKRKGYQKCPARSTQGPKAPACMTTMTRGYCRSSTAIAVGRSRAQRRGKKGDMRQEDHLPRTTTNIPTGRDERQPGKTNTKKNGRKKGGNIRLVFQSKQHHISSNI